MLQTAPPTPSTPATPPAGDADFEAFRRRAYQLTGLDLTSYKAPQMQRRLQALLQRLSVASFADYARLLQSDAQRRQEFRDYVTINVSEFFRDSERFRDLERKVLPQLLATGSALRIWSAGCSMGAEAYTIGILLSELDPRSARRHSILATDIDQTILDKARAGHGYLPSDIRNVHPERIARWFVPDGDGRFSVSSPLRGMIRFETHDLLRDPYPSGPFDLIACRNVVIYFTEEAKDRIYAEFVRRLRPGGVLFVGGTEAIMRPQALGLQVVGPGFYRKGGGA